MKSNVQDYFSLWNARLLEHFFSAASRDSEVWLQIDPDELNDIGRDLGGEEGFLNAVCDGPLWSTFRKDGQPTRGTSLDLVKRVQGLVTQRQSLHKRPLTYIDPEVIAPTYLGKRSPTYLPYLVALVRSVLLVQEGFYRHLQLSLGLSNTWGSSQMDQLSCAWEDLQSWTKENSGDFGYFKFRSLGGYSLIGVPKSQCIMTKKDCEAMGRIFTQMGLRPNQSPDIKLLDQIKQTSSEAPFLTAGFKDALTRSEFEEPITVRLKSLFKDWNGEAPAIKLCDKGGGQQAIEDRLELELCLNLQEGNQYPWIINFRIPPVLEDGEIGLNALDRTWSVHMRGTESVTADVQPSDAFQTAAQQIMGQSSERSVDFEIFRLSEGVNKPKIGDAYLRKASTRILVWAYDDLTRRAELRERPLPQVGVANLLICPRLTQRIKSQLSKHEIQFQELETNGLPAGWLLISILECSRLSESQRLMIVDGNSERLQQRPLRLVGGRPIRRAGIQQYLSYDLPFLELNAKSDATVYAEGLKLIEEMAEFSANFQSSIRRFKIIPDRQGANLYTLKAKQNGDLIDTQALRIAPESGEQVSINAQFSLGSLGETRYDQAGLRGVLPEDQITQNENKVVFQLETSALGDELDSKSVEQIRSHPLAKFLDSIAQLGSQSYGSSRDQIIRLTADCSGRNRSANTLLADLRGKGHIEFETNSKGYTTKFHAVMPAFVRLCMKADGNSVYGLIGSIRLKQWDFIEYAGDDFRLFKASSLNDYLPSFRIVVRDLQLFKELAEIYGFKVYDNPSKAIAEWAGGKEQVIQQITSIASESVGDKFISLERFNSNSGYFFPTNQMRCPTDGPTYQLFRMEDRDIKRLQIHRLGVTDGSSSDQRFGFVRDSRWGIWIALGALADHVKSKYGIQDASPWPITYIQKSGTLMLPEQISFPVVLERALNLCTGHSPIQLDLAKGLNQPSDLITLIRKDNGKEMCKVSVVYESMISCKWFAYEHVPEDIAIVVTSKVGATLMRVGN